MEVRSLTKPLEGKYRPIIDSGGTRGCFCQFEYLVTPSAESSAIEVVALDGADELTAQWLPCLQAGVERYARQRHEGGILLKGIRVAFRMTGSHPVDTHRRCVENVACSFMYNAIEPNSELISGR